MAWGRLNFAYDISGNKVRSNREMVTVSKPRCSNIGAECIQLALLHHRIVGYQHNCIRVCFASLKHRRTHDLGFTVDRRISSDGMELTRNPAAAVNAVARTMLEGEK